MDEGALAGAEEIVLEGREDDEIGGRGDWGSDHGITFVRVAIEGCA
jgi:hypothetical protein